MHAAQRLFLKQGVAATTIEQITIRAKVAKGTFYLYFSSKEDVLAALVARFAEQLLAKLKTAVGEADPRDWKARLAAWTAAAAEGYLDSIRLHDMLFYESHPPTREGLTDNVLIDDLASLLAAGTAAGAWRVDDPRFTALFLFSGLHAAVDSVFSKRKRVGRTQLIEHIQALFFRVTGSPADLLP